MYRVVAANAGMNAGKEKNKQQMLLLIYEYNSCSIIRALPEQVFETTQDYDLIRSESS